MPNWTLAHITDGATAIGRAFGRNRPGLVDVLHFLADARTPAGARLAVAGLTEEAIVSWRRTAGVRAGPPLLMADRVAFMPDVDRLIASVLERGPIMSLDLARALVGAELLTWRNAEEPELGFLLDALAIDRARLSAELDRSTSDRASFPFPRPYPGVNVFSRPEHLVIVPVGPGENGFSRERPSLALYAEPDVPAAELGQHLLAGLKRYGESEDVSASPYWKKLGFRTETAFLSRARLVMAHQRDFSVHFHPTAHLGRVRYDIMGTRTPVYAPIDDTASLGNALRAAIQASQG